MIVLKNPFEKTLKDSETISSNDMKLKINDKILSISNCFQDLQDIIKAHSPSNDEKVVNIQINNLTHHDTVTHIPKDDENQDYHKKYEPITTEFLQKLKNSKPTFNSDAFHSNYDDRIDKDKEDAKFETYSVKYCFQKIDEYYLNEIPIKANYGVFPFFTKKNNEIICSYTSLDQLQLLFDGYDIIIADFIVDDMIKIAENIKLQCLIDEICPLKEEMENIGKYNRFSEFEILLKFEEILKTIDNDNFDDKVALIYSIYVYIGEQILGEILIYFSQLNPEKESVYSRICDFIHSRFPEFQIKISLTNNNYNNEYDNASYFKQPNQKKTNLLLYENIRSDNVDALQKQVSNPKFNILKESIDLNLSNKMLCNKISQICNALDCAAFFGSLKCFKFLLLNTKLKSDITSLYAIIGGNTEIIHLCHQKKYSFINSLTVAIKYHRNDIAQWIVENKIEKNFYNRSRDFAFDCVHSFNYEMFQYLIDMKIISSMPIDDEIVIKYIIYIYQNYHVSVFYQIQFCFYFLKYKCLKYIDNGLIYCSKSKLEIIKFYANDWMNEFFNKDIFNPFLFLFHFIIFNKPSNFLITLQHIIMIRK